MDERTERLNAARRRVGRALREEVDGVADFVMNHSLTSSSVRHPISTLRGRLETIDTLSKAAYVLATEARSWGKTLDAAFDEFTDDEEEPAS